MSKLFVYIALIVIAFVPETGHAVEPMQPVMPQKQVVLQPRLDVVNKMTVERNALITRYNTELQQQVAIRNNNTAIELKNTLTQKRPINLGIDPTAPVISAIVPAGGIGPMQSFSILGANLSASGVSTQVTIQFAGKTPPIYYHGGANDGTRMDYGIGDFEGISGPTPAMVTVKVGNKVSASFPYSVFPGMVVQDMDLSKVQDHLMADSKSTSPLVNDPLGKGIHKFYMINNWTFAAMHDTWDLHTINKPAELTGSDEFFLTLKLLNNWKVKQIVWQDIVNKNTLTPACTVSTVASSSLKTVLNPNSPTNALYTKVDWWNQLCAGYRGWFYIGYIIEGPKGVPYH